MTWLQGYHILALALFMPALLVDPQLLAMSMAIAAALLVLVEVVRMGNVPYAGPRIHEFMTSFIDSRDAGALLVSHFSLLAGEQVSLCTATYGDLRDQHVTGLTLGWEGGVLISSCTPGLREDHVSI